MSIFTDELGSIIIFSCGGVHTFDSVFFKIEFDGPRQENIGLGMYLTLVCLGSRLVPLF